MQLETVLAEFVEDEWILPYLKSSENSLEMPSLIVCADLVVDEMNVFFESDAKLSTCGFCCLGLWFWNTFMFITFSEARASFIWLRISLRSSLAMLYDFL